MAALGRLRRRSSTPRWSMTSARRHAGAPDGWDERRPAGAPGEEQVGDAADQEEAAVDGLLPDSGKNPPHEVDSDSAAAVDADFDALLANVKRERDDYLEIAQRARADFENYRKRAAREAQEAERRGKAGLARELVPALDNLERALRAAGIDPDPGTSGKPGEAPSEEVSAHEALARGVALVYGELRAALERAGVETYDPTGERFDPATSEAVSVRAGGDGVDPGVVIETIDKGYRLDGQVLRAARVVVSE
jgi:molecular chaperone GrpE